MSIRGLFIERLRTFLATHGVGRGEFGTLAVADRKFVRHLEMGKPITLARIEAAEAFMARIDGAPAELALLRTAAADRQQGAA